MAPKDSLFGSHLKEPTDGRGWSGGSAMPQGPRLLLSFLFTIARGFAFFPIHVLPSHHMMAIPLMTCAYSKQEVRK